MIPPSDPAGPPAREGWRAELSSLDVAVYAAIAQTPTPRLDRMFRRLLQS